MSHRGKWLSWAAGMAALLSMFASATASAGRPAGKPAYLWLWYADDQNPVPTGGYYCTANPVFNCSYGTSVEDCQRQVQDYLDLWYADFNIVFSLGRPPTGDFYQMIITSGGTGCPDAPNEAGIAPVSCNDYPGQTGYAFDCGRNAHDCATIIAHEHGHMVGLIHSISASDVMNGMVLRSTTGFLDDDALVLDDYTNICSSKTQNSYQRMLGTLGTWPGGAKPSPFASTPDAGAADAPTADAADTARTGGSVGPGTGPFFDGGEVVGVPGYDALVRPPLPTVDAAERGSPGGGCSLVNPPIPPGTLVVALLCLLAAGLIRGRGRRGRPAGEPLPCARPSRPPSPDPVREPG